VSTDLDIGIKRTVESKRTAVVKIHYGQMGMMQLRIGTTDTGAILDELTGRIATAPKFFQRTAVCLDLADLLQVPDIEEVKAVLDAVRRAGMVCVGLAGGSTEVDGLASALNLPLLSSFRAANNPFATAQPAPASVAAVPPVAPAAQTAPAAPATAATHAAPTEVALASMIHNQTVRSGQRVYARARDLVITAGVGAGAEVMADGCVHIYGSLRGRAMAGVHGELTARVFCQEFHAELVSIAGVFRVFETIPSELAGKPVQAWLDGEDLNFALVGN
jgi:septum site-determining protein MinC